jgi:peptidoglycan/xylan/chitin deacetylase (PgdA/CDA1 family)
MPSKMHTETLRKKLKVSFTFDDGYLSTFSLAFPILKEQGFKGTVFAITDYIGKSWKGQPTMNISQLRELYSNGWEIGSHTKSHPHLSTLSNLALDNELKESKEYLKRHIPGCSVVCLSYPFSDFDRRTVFFAKRYYKLGRIGNFCPPIYRNSYPVGSSFNLQAVSGFAKSRSIPLRTVKKLWNCYYSVKPLSDAVHVLSGKTGDFVSGKTQEIPSDLIKSWIAQLKEKNLWLILGFHNIVKDADDSGEGYSLEKLVDIVNYIKKQNVDTVTLQSSLLI